MRIDDSFTVPLPVEEAWGALLDPQRIAPCVPGAELRDVTDGVYRGVVTVRVGTVTARYEGALRFTQVDEAARRFVLTAEGEEAAGQGSAGATVTATLQPAGEDRTEVAIEAELTLSGQVAELDGESLADAASKLVADFAGCLGRDPLSGSRVATEGAIVTPEEIVADEVADVAVDDPERAAQLVSAVTKAAPETVEATPAGPGGAPAVARGSVAERAMPAALVGVLLLQVLPKGRLKRLGLAVLGSALVAGLVAGQEQRQR